MDRVEPPDYRADPDRWWATTQSLIDQGYPEREAVEIAVLQEVALALTSILVNPDPD